VAQSTATILGLPTFAAARFIARSELACACQYRRIVPRQTRTAPRKNSSTIETEAQLFIAGIEKRSLRSLALNLHEYLLRESVIDYVKTIYIGYESQGEMFAALYRNVNAIEIALPLPEDESGPLIMDASHLTWRTLPLMIHVTHASQLTDAFAVIDRAFGRLKSGLHLLNRTNEFFIARKKGRPMRK
jgi:hypothetical protein